MTWMRGCAHCSGMAGGSHIAWVLFVQINRKIKKAQDLVVDHDVNASTNCIRLEIAEVECLHNDTLATQCCITMHYNCHCTIGLHISSVEQLSSDFAQHNWTDSCNSTSDRMCNRTCFRTLQFVEGTGSVKCSHHRSWITRLLISATSAQISSTWDGAISELAHGGLQDR